MDIQELGDTLPEDEDLELSDEESMDLQGRSKEIDWKALRAQIARLGEAGAQHLLTDEESQTILLNRARALAIHTDEDDDETEVTEIVTFAWGDENFAIETFYVREIVLPRRITDTSYECGVPGVLQEKNPILWP